MAIIIINLLYPIRQYCTGRATYRSTTSLPPDVDQCQLHHSILFVKPLSLLKINFIKQMNLNKSKVTDACSPGATRAVGVDLLYLG